MDETIPEIRRIAEKVIDRQTKNMVADAMLMARWILAHVEPETVPEWEKQCLPL